MNRQEFWQLIDQAREQAGGDAEVQTDRLKEALLAQAPERITAFQEHFHRYHIQADRRLLWAAAYIIGGGCSDDGFTDFRYWLISRGEAVYEAALTNPDALAELLSEADEAMACQCEVFGYVAGEAWTEKTGKPWNEMPRGERIVLERVEEEDWQEEDLPRLLPALWARFGEGVEGEAAAPLGEPIPGSEKAMACPKCGQVFTAPLVPLLGFIQTRNCPSCGPVADLAGIFQHFIADQEDRIGLVLGGETGAIAAALLQGHPDFQDQTVEEAENYVRENLREGRLHLPMPRNLGTLYVGLLTERCPDVSVEIMDTDPLATDAPSPLRSAFRNFELKQRLDLLKKQSTDASGEALQSLWQEIDATYEELLALEPDPGLYLNWGSELNRQANLLEKSDPAAARELWARATEKTRAALELNPHYARAHFNLGIFCNNEAAIVEKAEPETSHSLRQQAVQHFRAATAADSDYVEAYNQCGNTLTRLCKSASADEYRALRADAHAQFEQALVARPSDAQSLFNWGISLAAEAQWLATTDLSTALDVWRQAEEKHRAAQAADAKAEILYSWGNALLNRAQARASVDPAAALADNAEAAEKYRRALAAASNHLNALANRGVALVRMAQLLQDEDLPRARRLWADANEQYARATAIKPGFMLAARNWALNLHKEARALKNVDRAEAARLFDLARERYRYVLDREPDAAPFWTSLGGALIGRAAVENDAEQQAALEAEALACLDRSETLQPGHASYNWACLESRRGNLDAAMDWLRRYQQAGNLKDIDFMEKDSDLHNLRSTAMYQEFVRMLREQSR